MILIFFTIQSNNRAEQAFGSLIRPLVQARPVDLAFKDPDRVVIAIKIVNYSNFDALRVRTDVMFNGSQWIGEWARARIKALKKLEEVRKLNAEEKVELDMRIKNNINDLPANNSGQPVIQIWEGAIEKRDRHKIALRTMWVNEKGFEFERIDNYLVEITGASGETVYSFLPDFERPAIKNYSDGTSL